MAPNIGGLDVNRVLDWENGLLSREIFVNEDVYQQEQEQIFSRTWLFIGHQNQVAKPGDYFVSRMGSESVILSRDRDNTIHVFLNSCRHRGMKVCRYDEGNTPVFTCPYHGWSYAGDGSLVGVPRYKDAYREELDKSQWGLVEVAQLANYKGTIWATWDPKAPSFLEYVGDMEPFMSVFLNKPDGSEADLEVVGGVHKWTLGSNWKWGAENFIGDSYHGRPTHRSTDLIGSRPGGAMGRGLRRESPGNEVYMSVSHHGSGWRTGLRLSDSPYQPLFPNSPVIDEYLRGAYERRKKLPFAKSRVLGNGGNIFPNATFGAQLGMAVWHPQGPSETEVWRWYFVDSDAPSEVRELWRHYSMLYSGPVGVTEQDDSEAWSYAQKASNGTIARRYPYNYAIGLGQETRYGKHRMGQHGLLLHGLVIEGVAEQNQRGMYAMWAALMGGAEWEDVRSGREW